MNLSAFNQLNSEEAATQLLACCGSENWKSLTQSKMPFSSEKEMVEVIADVWYNQCSTADWLESFTHHPKIGDVKSLTEKYAGKEQASVADATKETIAALANANAEYEKKYGFIFIVCATGKSAAEMLRLLQDRLKNSKEEELFIAMGEQMKITVIRLQKLLTEANWGAVKPSQITTHVLDTSIGKPGKDISIRLQKKGNENWQTFSQGISNADGRVADLLPPGSVLPPGNYKIVFETLNYFGQQDIKGFYPEVEIQFSIFDNAHYHVPLLINPFGYSTYRGS